MLKFGCAISGLLVGAMPLAATAQDAPAAPQEQPAPGETGEPPVAMEEMPDDIVVTGEVRGAVVGEIPPERQLTPADIRAYGVSNIAELVAELAPETRSGRGRGGGGPVMLLNGRRISNFSEIRDLPTEAIERVDILPEEVALKYGYRADQRVVNIVLRPRFRAITGELDGRMPTAGGNSTAEGELGVLRIGNRGRVSVNMEYERVSSLLESERDIVPAGEPVLPDLGGGIADLARYRTLVAPNEQLTLNGVVSRNLSESVSASFYASLEVTHREALLGLPGASLTLPADNPFSPFDADRAFHVYPEGAGALGRDTAGQSAHLGFTVNGDAKPWRWSVTGNYDRVHSRSYTSTGLDADSVQARLDAGDPTLDPFGSLPVGLFDRRPIDIARSTSNVGSLDALLNGPLVELPAGDIAASVRLTGRTSDYASESLRSGVAREGSVARDSGSAQLNLDLPIASRRKAVLSGLGDLSLNANVEVEQLSDFGTLVTTGYGATWSPIKQVRLLASVTDEEGAPSAQQLGDPFEATPNSRVFDYIRGETADVTLITGGNPRLGADSRNVFKLGLTAQPISNLDLNLRADYVRSVTRDQIASFPSASAEVEKAFPDRFVREGTDGTGRLLSVDARPVNFDRAEREELRWGFNLSVPLKSNLQKQIEQRRAEREAQRAEAERTGQPLPERPRREGREGRPGGEGGQRWGGPGGGGFGGRGGFARMAGPNGAAAGRIHFSLYHTLHLADRVTIREGLPVLDLLDGSAVGNRGGQSRHELEMQAGYSKDGLGLRLNTRWQSGTEVRSGAPGSGETLDFSSLATVNLRAFADMGQVMGRSHRWARGMRVTFGVDNLFDSRLRVTDANGTVPLTYQPDLLDPTGRVIRVSIRKLFF